MPDNTPNRGYQYPLYTDTQQTRQDIETLALDFDTDIEALADQIDGALNRPSCALQSTVGQVVPVSTQTALTWSIVDYDNDSMANTPAGINLIDDGIYLLIARVTVGVTATATRTDMEVVFTSTGGFIPNPCIMGMSSLGTEEKIFNLACLHYTDGSPVDAIAVSVRHNDPNPVTIGARNFTATKISNLLSGS